MGWNPATRKNRAPIQKMDEKPQHWFLRLLIHLKIKFWRSEGFIDAQNGCCRGAFFKDPTRNYMCLTYPKKRQQQHFWKHLGRPFWVLHITLEEVFQFMLRLDSKAKVWWSTPASYTPPFPCRNAYVGTIALSKLCLWPHRATQTLSLLTQGLTQGSFWWRLNTDTF